ncbi:hypothetical protein C8R45DRAFT_1082665 [Mycena sanguinolenta]|nr:hypothetical protein C8R45DRAFT_1082665 [Mycena sanguinolenta]
MPYLSQHDIDVLLGCCDPAEVARVKECLRSHPHFVGYALKIYYTEVCDSDSVDLPEEEILQHLKSHPHNVLIETLAAGTLGLPTDLAEVYTPEGFPYIRILHPKILILTKLGRWRNTVISTRPKTRLRAQSDEEDLVYMIEWLAERDFTIAFDLYKANTRPRASLVKDVRMFWDKRISDCDDVTIGFLKRALAPPDREVIMKAQEEEGNIYEVARDAVDRPPLPTHTHTPRSPARAHAILASTSTRMHTHTEPRGLAWGAIRLLGQRNRNANGEPSPACLRAGVSGVWVPCTPHHAAAVLHSSSQFSLVRRRRGTRESRSAAVPYQLVLRCLEGVLAAAGQKRARVPIDMNSRSEIEKRRAPSAERRCKHVYRGRSTRLEEERERCWDWEAESDAHREAGGVGNGNGGGVGRAAGVASGGLDVGLRISVHNGCGAQVMEQQDDNVAVEGRCRSRARQG